jgi:hypothetical protein
MSESAVRRATNAWIKRNIDSWRKLIPRSSYCQVCGKRIFFHPAANIESMVFDHRRGNELIQGKPYKWLTSHKCTPENERIWISCDFGVLCSSCNLRLPTVNRIEWLRNALEYSSK